MFIGNTNFIGRLTPVKYEPFETFNQLCLRLLKKHYIEYNEKEYQYPVDQLYKALGNAYFVKNGTIFEIIKIEVPGIFTLTRSNGLEFDFIIAPDRDDYSMQEALQECFRNHGEDL